MKNKMISIFGLLMVPALVLGTTVVEAKAKKEKHVATAKKTKKAKKEKKADAAPEAAPATAPGEAAPAPMDAPAK
jgi:hypothetical protein